MQTRFDVAEDYSVRYAGSLARFQISSWQQKAFDHNKTVTYFKTSIAVCISLENLYPSLVGTEVIKAPYTEFIVRFI